MLYASDLVQELAPMEEWELNEFFRKQSSLHQPNRWALFYDWTEQHQFRCFIAWAIVLHLTRSFTDQDHYYSILVSICTATAVVFLPILVARALYLPGAEWQTREVNLNGISDREYALLGGRERCKCWLSCLMRPVGRGMMTPLAEVTWITVADASTMRKELVRRGVRTWVYAVEI